jgi:hypothetical protein
MEQRALLVLDEDEWLLIRDDDDPEQGWQDEQTALAKLKQDGWSVEVGPSTLHAEGPGVPARRVQGYVLRRSVH